MLELECATDRQFDRRDNCGGPNGNIYVVDPATS